MNDPPRALPGLRLAFSRSIGDGSFEVERFELEVVGDSLSKCREELSWMLSRVRGGGRV